MSVNAAAGEHETAEAGQANAAVLISTLLAACAERCRLQELRCRTIGSRASHGCAYLLDLRSKGLASCTDVTVFLFSQNTAKAASDIDSFKASVQLPYGSFEA